MTHDQQALTDPALVPGWFLGCLLAHDASSRSRSDFRTFAPFVPAPGGPSETELAAAMLRPFDGSQRTHWVAGLRTGLLRYAEGAFRVETVVLGLDFIAAIEPTMALATATLFFRSLAAETFHAQNTELAPEEMALPIALAALSACPAHDVLSMYDLIAALHEARLWSPGLLAQEARIRISADPWNAAEVLRQFTGLEQVFAEEPSSGRFFAQLLHAQLSLEQVLLLAIRMPDWVRPYANPAWFKVFAGRQGQRAPIHFDYDVYEECYFFRDEEKTREDGTEEICLLDDIGAHDPSIAELRPAARSAALEEILETMGNVYGDDFGFSFAAAFEPMPQRAFA